MVVNIHFVTGSKGNVGKTALAESLVVYYYKHKKKLILVDGDKDVPALSKTCPTKQLAFSDDPELSTQPDTISKLAYEESQKKNGADILVDLPAGGERPLNDWMDECGIDALAETYGFKLIKWWVSDSDMDSIKMFETSLKGHPKIQHVLLKNMGKSKSGQWASFDGNKALKTLIKECNAAVLEIPRVEPMIINWLRANKISLTQVIEDKKFKLVDIAANLRVNTWVTRTGSLIEQIMQFDGQQDATATDSSSEEAAQQDATATNGSSEKVAVAAKQEATAENSPSEKAAVAAK